MHTETQQPGTPSPASGEGVARVEYLENGVAVLYLGASSERVVTLTETRMNSIAEQLQRLRQQKPPGLIITGPHLEMFTAGADINVIRDVTDPKIGEQLARQGQNLFDEIESLPFATVAAISGPCVGGGCELVLACRYRIISDHKSSSIGLPETKLGILPGFGGTQRLPRLIGLPKALDIILAGKVLKPKQALKYGLVDEVLHAENLVDRASTILTGEQKPRRSPIPFFERLATSNALVRGFAKRKAESALKKQTKGFYPAPPAALEAV
ncbi:MAG: enoyl-CoA hydratase/isomerase family protein, partial [Deltaproteobacteria bacterium]|nr:enoyl-CoA hydratase/isomerase family protein [Deltaproteobacteria bacterium]